MIMFIPYEFEIVIIVRTKSQFLHVIYSHIICYDTRTFENCLGMNSKPQLVKCITESSAYSQSIPLEQTLNHLLA